MHGRARSGCAFRLPRSDPIRNEPPAKNRAGRRANACRPLIDPVAQWKEHPSRKGQMPVRLGPGSYCGDARLGRLALSAVAPRFNSGHLHCSLCWFVSQPSPRYHGQSRKPSGCWPPLLAQPVTTPRHPCGSTAWGCGPLPDDHVSVVFPLPSTHYMTTQIFCNTIYFVGGQVLSRMVESNHEKTPVKPWRVCIGAKDNPAASAEWPV